MLLIIGLGLPLYIYIALTRLRDRDLLGSRDILNTYGFMYIIYPSKRPYFDAIVLIRKLALIVALAATTDGAIQSAATIGVSLIYLIYICVQTPFDKFHFTIG